MDARSIATARHCAPAIPKKINFYLSLSAFLAGGLERKKRYLGYRKQTDLRHTSCFPLGGAGVAPGTGL